VSQANIGKLIYGPLDAEALLDDNAVTLCPSRIDMGKGYLRFKGLRNFRPKPGMHWISHIHIVQEPAQNLIQLIHPGASLLVENGWINQNSPILKVLALISLKRIFKPGSPRVQGGRLYFDRIEGNIEIEKKKILMHNLTFQSPAINAAGTGTIDLGDHLQLKIGLQPLGTLDSLVSKIPVIGNILTGKEKSLIIYSLEVTGSLSNPQIKNVPFKNIGESFLEYIEQMVFTTERILKSLMSLKDSRPLVPDYQAEFDRMTPGS
jgi:hypothetical protein